MLILLMEQSKICTFNSDDIDKNHNYRNITGSYTIIANANHSILVVTSLCINLVEVEVVVSGYKELLFMQFA